jgi:uncharacterized protein
MLQRLAPAEGGGIRGAGMALLALLVLLLAGPSAALDFPVLSGRVVDEAGILDLATRTALTDKLAALEAKTSDQLVVVTLKSLQGTSIEDFGVELGRRWKVGQKDKNNGVVLIVAPSERKVRIEVGYGLEGTLTDAVSRLIIENAIVPRFRAGDFPGGISRAVDDIISVLTGDAEEWKQRAAKRPDPQPGWDPVLLFILILVIFVLVSFAVARNAPVGTVRRGGGWSNGSGWSSGGGFGGGFGGGSSGGGGFSGGGGSFGGGGSSGSW